MRKLVLLSSSLIIIFCLMLLVPKQSDHSVQDGKNGKVRLLERRSPGPDRPRSSEPNRPKSLDPQAEMHVKKSLVTTDIEKTDQLCRSQCVLDFKQALRHMPHDNPQQISTFLKSLQIEHQHMDLLIWSTPGSSPDEDVRIISDPDKDLDFFQKYLKEAKRTSLEGKLYQSEKLRHNGHFYFVLGVPTADHSAALIGLVHQDILQKVADHGKNNLRVDIYPSERNYKIESVNPKTLYDVKVNDPEDNEGVSHYRKNQVVVKFIDPPAQSELRKIQTDIDGKMIKKLGTTYVFESKKMDAKQMMQYFKTLQIAYVEPNFLYMTNALPGIVAANHAVGGVAQRHGVDDVADGVAQRHGVDDIAGVVVPNDPLYSEYQWNLPIVETEKGWQATRGKEDVIIAVVDTGVDLDHPDLVGRLLKGYNAMEPEQTPMDDLGHGTHVAGIISALVDNGEGIAGMTWYNKILPIKVLDSTGAGSTYSVAEGIIWATDHGAKVINLSLGNYAEAQFLHDAIKYAFNKDVVLVAASGNDNTGESGYPAAYPEVLAVSATDAHKKRAPFSNYGNYIDVMAPGVSIASTYPHNQYAALSGTSMASPHAAASAALIRSVNPSLTNIEVMDIMRKTAEDLGAKGKDQYYGFGQIDIVKALQEANAMGLQWADEQGVQGTDRRDLQEIGERTGIETSLGIGAGLNKMKQTVGGVLDRLMNRAMKGIQKISDQLNRSVSESVQSFFRGSSG